MYYSYIHNKKDTTSSASGKCANIFCSICSISVLSMYLLSLRHRKFCIVLSCRIWNFIAIVAECRVRERNEHITTIIYFNDECALEIVCRRGGGWYSGCGERIRPNGATSFYIYALHTNSKKFLCGKLSALGFIPCYITCNLQQLFCHIVGRIIFYRALKKFLVVLIFISTWAE